MEEVLLLECKRCGWQCLIEDLDDYGSIETILEHKLCENCGAQDWEWEILDEREI